MWMNGEETEHEQLIERGQNKDSSANHDRIILTHQKLRIRITKAQWDRIRNMLNLSFPVGAPNNGLSQNRIF
jgi:hypothetical protein